MANRYSKIGLDIAYSPESFKDMAVAPFALRERHDKLLDYQDNLLKELNNIDVQKEGMDYYNQRKSEIEGKVNDLTKRINSVGAGSPNLINEFRNLKRDYEKETSLAGGIGYLANLKKEVDDTKSQYQKFAIANGWNPEKMKENFDTDYNNFFKDFDTTNLGTDKFIRNKFEPTFAPKRIDVYDSVKDMKGILGHVSDLVGSETVKPIINPQTGAIAFQTSSNKQLTSDNRKNLDAAESFFNSKLMDPNSPEMASMRYENPGLDDNTLRMKFLEQSGKALDIMHIRETEKTNKEDVSGWSGGVSGGSGKEPKEPKAGTLISTPGGLSLTDETSVSDLLSNKYIADFEKKEKDPKAIITDEEIAKKKAVEMQTYKVKEILQDPKTVNKINASLAKEGLINSFTGKKLNNIEDYKQYILQSNEAKNKYDNISQQIGNLQRKGYSQYSPEILGLEKQLKNTGYEYVLEAGGKSIEDKTASKTLDKAFKEVVPVDGLKYSKVYTFGYTEDDKKFMDQLNATVNNQGDKWVNQLENAGGSFSLGDEVFSRNVDQTKYTKKIEDLKTALKSGDGKFEFGSIVDAGSTGSSQIEVKYSYGTGDDKQSGSMYIDYDNKSTDHSSIDAMLTEMKKNLDFRGQAIVESVMDNKKLAGLPVDNTPYWRGGISDYQSNKVKKYSKMFNADQNYNQDYKNADYVNNPQWSKSKFNIVMNKDGFHELYRKDPGQEVSYIPVGQWFKRESAKNYNNKLYPIADISKANTLTEKQMFVNEIRGFAQLSEDNNVIQVDSNSPKYKKLRDDYILQLNQNSDNLSKQIELTNFFYNEIKGMKIGHKSKKRII